MFTRSSRILLLLYSLVVLGASTTILVVAPEPAVAQNISGVINQYASVLQFDYCANTATVASNKDFAVGDSVLIIQMTGVTVDESNSSSFGKIIQENGIANIEFARISALPNSTTIRFASSLLHNNYNTLYGSAPEGATQIIKVPVYSNAVVTGTLTAPVWDGQTGGVLVLLATGTVTLNAPIDVSGLGFAGGAAPVSTGTTHPNMLDYFYPDQSDSSGLKGNGLVGTPPATIASGRGAIATGGGGGNGDNSGGAGGGSHGAGGGNGGDQTSWVGRLSNGGVGGYSHTGFAGQLYLMMGGGGGTGHQNDLGTSKEGGAGGGVAIIITPGLTSNGNGIFASGLPGGDRTLDGASGGGGGGSVYIFGTSDPSTTVIANGGDGGSPDASADLYGYGPGGGGAGGAVWCGTPAVTITSNGGNPGRITNCLDPTLNGTPYGATAGQSNNARYPVIAIPASTDVFNPPAASTPITSTCAGESVAISAFGGDSYIWTPGGMTTDTIIVSPAGTTVYSVKITKGACDFTDTVHLDVLPKPIASVTGSLAPCNDGTAQPYSVVAEPNTSYHWTVIGGTSSRFDSSTVDIIWAGIGTDTLILKADRGACETLDTAIVTVGTEVIPLIIGLDTICEGTSTRLGTSVKYASYLWHPTNETTDSITVTTPGTYRVDVTSAGGCKGTSAPMSIVVHSKPLLSIKASQDTLVAIGDSIQLTVPKSYPRYLWSTTDTTPSIVIADSGTYSVMVMDSNGCTSLDSIDIPLAAPQPDMTLGLSTLQAYAGDHVVLPVNILRSHNVNALAATAYSYTLKFNKSLLAPSDPAIAATSTYNGPWRTVTVSGNRDGSSVLSQVGFTAALGDSLTTPIFINQIEWSGGRSIITSYDTGTFVLLGICTAGGNRLFSEDGTVILSSIRPNPVHDLGAIDYSLAEPGQTDLLILDMLGRTVLTLESDEAMPGEKHVVLDAAQLPNGVYHMVLRTPTQVLTSKMEVFH